MKEVAERIVLKNQERRYIKQCNSKLEQETTLKDHKQYFTSQVKNIFHKNWSDSV